MTMQELGEAFHSARLSQGLTLEDVNKQTKISIYVLDALEKGAHKSLPHPVYTKKFIKDYACLLGLDEAKILQEYLTLVGPVETLEPNPGVSNLSVRRIPRNRTGGWLVLVFLIVLAGGAWLGVSYISKEVVVPRHPVIAEERVDNASSVNGTSELVTEPVESPSGKDIKKSVVATIEKKNVPQKDAVPALTTPDTGNQDEKNAVTDTQQQALEAVTNTTVGVRGTELSDNASDIAGSPTVKKYAVKEHLFVVTARDDCWLSAFADGRKQVNVSERYLRPGESFSISFVKTLEIKLGNAGGIDILLDGHPYPVDAKLGQVKTLLLDARTF